MTPKARASKVPNAISQFSEANDASTRAHLEALIMYLEDEFRGVSGVRLRKVQPASLTRSPDLEQDYDPMSSNLHVRRGVSVNVRGREFFFSTEMAAGPRSHVESQVVEMRAYLEMQGDDRQG